MKAAVAHRAPEADAAFDEYTLRKVLSWLEMGQLLGSAALVSKRWRDASSCREVWRRRMHPAVLELLSCASNGRQAQQAAAERPPAKLARSLSPSRLFACLYQSNLLANGSFLERGNTAARPAAASLGNGGGGQHTAGRRTAWEATFNARGMTWAHPFDFFPELPPVPCEAALAAKPFSVGCLATGPHSAGWSEVVQVVDLVEVLQAQGLPAGLAGQLLASGLTLELSVHVAGGAIAGGEYQVVLMLLSAEDVQAAASAQIPLVALPRMSLPFGHPPSGSRAVADVATDNLRELGLRGSRAAAKAPLQPPPGDWLRYSCRLALPTQPGAAAAAVVALRGRATRNRHGHYATKFAAAKLRVLTADEA